jgi:hypothetical protein
MHDMRTRPGLVRRGWLRMLDGEFLWGSLDIRPDRFGVTRYRLVVFPPGISEPERRWVRLARGWPLWGALVWVMCEATLSQVTGAWTALIISTAACLAVGLTAMTMAGEARTKVRTIGAIVMAGYHDPVLAATRDKLKDLAATLVDADQRLEGGQISAAHHEMIWWRVYNELDSAHSAAPGTYPSGRDA